MPLFHGVFTALVTPFSPAGDRIDLGRLSMLVARQAAGGVAGVVPCGTTGETPTLSDAEQRSVIETVVAEARPHGLRVVAGAGSNCTAHAVELHRRVRDLGADGALHVCPYYNKPSQEGLYRHFSTIADACELPVMLYNIPGRTGVGLTIETIERLAGHPNIEAIKEASGSMALASKIVARTGLTLLSGDDPLTLPIMVLGGRGVVSVLGNLIPRQVADLCRVIDDGQLIDARARHERLAPLAEMLLAIDTNPVPIKTALALLGLDSGTVRLPLVPPTADIRRRVGETLAAYGLHSEVSPVITTPQSASPSVA